MLSVHHMIMEKSMDWEVAFHTSMSRQLNVFARVISLMQDQDFTLLIL